MGNRLGKRRDVVDEKYTRPQGLYQHRDVDHKKLRRLILDSKLAPCYPGDEEWALDLEECPICFLNYPSLNRSRCCMKGICTECFLQMKHSQSTCPTHCPFCKTSNYAVEYRGMRTKEEKWLEEMEAQKVIEAKLRMQQQECQDEEERIQKRQSLCSSSRTVTPGEIECREIPSGSLTVPCVTYASQTDEFASSHIPCLLPLNWPLHFRQNRGEVFDPDLDGIKVMEAIFHSVQVPHFYPNGQCFEQGNRIHRAPTFPLYPSFPEYFSPYPVLPIQAASAGFACAAAAPMERQHTAGDIVGAADMNGTALVMLPQSIGLPMGERCVDYYLPETGDIVGAVDTGSSALPMLPQCIGLPMGERLVDYYPPETGDIVGAADMSRTALLMLPQSIAFPTGERPVDYPPDNWIVAPPGSGRAAQTGDGKWNADYGPELAEVGTSYASSRITVNEMAVLPPSSGWSMLAGYLLPQSFEEQMMLAMAASLADVRARMSTQLWHGCSY